ncbi:MAG: beta-propeller domain-containing protein [Oscillospiraceae bacterium]|nr:beta-propeller domain-containing protein [Oscillospiraceae bacterium]
MKINNKENENRIAQMLRSEIKSITPHNKKDVISKTVENAKMLSEYVNDREMDKIVKIKSRNFDYKKLTSLAVSFCLIFTILTNANGYVFQQIRNMNLDRSYSNTSITDFGARNYDEVTHVIGRINTHLYRGYSYAYEAGSPTAAKGFFAGVGDQISNFFNSFAFSSDQSDDYGGGMRGVEYDTWDDDDQTSTSTTIRYGRPRPPISDDAEIVSRQGEDEWEYLIGFNEGADDLDYEEDSSNDGFELAGIGGEKHISHDSSDQAASVSDREREISDTNEQVEGVGEADIVKTDGDYIYALLNRGTGDNNEYKSLDLAPVVKIISIKDPENMKLTSTIQLPLRDLDLSNHIEEMYVWGDRVILLSRIERDDPNNNYTDPYGYSYYKQMSFTAVTVYDITDRSAPVLDREFVQEGSYVTSRFIENHMYLITSKMVNTSSHAPTAEQVVPYICDSAAGGAYRMMSARDIMIPSNPAVTNFTVVSGIDLTDGGKKASTKSTIGSAGTVYVSKDNIYIAIQSFGFNAELLRGIEMPTPVADVDIDSFRFSGGGLDLEILKFGIDNGQVSVKSRTAAPGRVLNQFSMDEHNGYFRIATTRMDSESWQEINGVYIFDDELKLVGLLDDIAPDESIYSVRYAGDRMYMVTFRQVDPFFVIDLSDPTAPKVLGELKIPGFSNYLHVYSENLVIGLGQEADWNGRTQGMKVSLFDVSDEENPIEVSKYVFTEDGAYSDALYNHKSFMFSKEKDIIAFPVNYQGTVTQEATMEQQVDGGVVYVYPTVMHNNYSVFAIFGVDENNQLYKRAFVEHSVGNAYMYDPVLRGCYVDDVLFTVSQNKVVSTSLIDFVKISELVLG